MKTVVFADLDGTLLTEVYSLTETKKEVAKLLSNQISIVLCSSKTKPEVEYYRKEMKIIDPFITENGAAIFIPPKYFEQDYSFTEKTEKYRIIELGIPYQKLRQKLEEIKSQTGSEIVGFGDMTPKEVAKDTGLSLELSEMAKMRGYDEPFRIVSGDEKKIFSEINRQGLQVVKGGKYYHLSGKHDKGQAVALLASLYQKEFENIRTIAVGNGQNDLPMLNVVDNPFFIGENENMNSVWRRIVEIALNT